MPNNRPKINVVEKTAQPDNSEDKNSPISPLDKEKSQKLPAKTKTKSFVERPAGTLGNHVPDIDLAKQEYLDNEFGH